MEYTKIELPIHMILVQHDGTGAGSVTCDPGIYGVCPGCERRECIYQCDESLIGEVESEDDIATRLKCNGAIDGILSLILAQACAGINIGSPAYLNSLQTAFDAIINNE